MFKKIISFLILTTFLYAQNVKADEGMWLPFLIQAKIGAMQQKGLKLSAEDIYSLNNTSIKDAIVTLDQGSCTAEVVSANGLLFTNHHCGYGEIQQHSSVDHDYLTDGFWAGSYAEELANPGKTATFLVRLEDVTDKVLAELNDDMSETERNQAIVAISSEIEKEAIGNTHYEASVESFFENNHFYLFVYETFKDIRLVGAPPSSIGKYGGDTDNWEWPRHTGDFAIFRIYTGPDGKPAEYSQDNIPLNAKYHLKISLKGVKEGDFTMVFGYPGTTNRYFTSWGVENEMDNVNFIRAKVRTEKLRLMKEDMHADDKVRIQYASKYSRSANSWKYSIVQNRSLEALDVVGQKKDWQVAYNNWTIQNKERSDKYGEALKIIENYYSDKNIQNAEKARNYWFEAIYQGSEAVSFSLQARRLEQVLAQAPTNTAALYQTLEALRESGKDFYKDYNAPTDQKISAALLSMYNMNVPEKYRLSIVKEVHEKYKSCEKYTEEMFKSSVFTNEERYNNFLELPNSDAVMEKLELLHFADYMYEITKDAKTDKELSTVISEKLQSIKNKANDHFDKFNADEDKEKFINAFTEAYGSAKNLPGIFKTIEAQFGGSIEAFANALFENSLLTDKKRFDKFIKKPKIKVLNEELAFKTGACIKNSSRAYILQNDMVYNTMISALDVYRKLMGEMSQNETKLAKGRRLFLAGLLERAPKNSIYPDANSTLRLTYGTVGGYEPADAVVYDYYTTIDGYINKVDMDDEEFTTTQRMLDLYKKKEYGRYAQAGTLRTCFISNNDITGGNSGSPVLNGDGHLIGIAFDGNSEALSGDIIFENELQKCINVDIRFVLWTIDIYANANHIMKDLDIVQ